MCSFNGKDVDLSNNLVGPDESGVLECDKPALVALFNGNYHLPSFVLMISVK